MKRIMWPVPPNRRLFESYQSYSIRYGKYLVSYGSALDEWRNQFNQYVGHESTRPAPLPLSTDGMAPNEFIVWPFFMIVAIVTALFGGGFYLGHGAGREHCGKVETREIP